MDNDAKNISVENDAIEMPFTEDTGDVFEDAKPETDPIEMPFDILDHLFHNLYIHLFYY